MNLEYLELKDTDNAIFLSKVKNLINSLVNKYCPMDVYTIRINKWFDHKWLNYSGIGIVAFEFDPEFREVALDEFWQDRLTLPPFNPKQVGEECYWRKNVDGKYNFIKNYESLYKRKLQPSANNLQKRITSLTQSGIFIWYSSNTKENMRGSIMVYIVNGETTNTWFCSVNLESAFKVEKIKGAGRDLVIELIEK